MARKCKRKMVTDRDVLQAIADMIEVNNACEPGDPSNIWHNRCLSRAAEVIEGRASLRADILRFRSQCAVKRALDLPARHWKQFDRIGRNIDLDSDIVAVVVLAYLFDRDGDAETSGKAVAA